MTGPGSGERRSGWLLVLALAAHLILIASQVAAPAGGTLLESWLLGALGPAAGAIDQAGDLLARIGRAFSTQGRLRRDNRELELRVEELERRLSALHGVEGDYARLAEAVEYARSLEVPLKVADVVHADLESGLRALVLRVEGARARVDQPVVTEQGLIGRVVLVRGPWAKVQVVTDSSASVGAMIERTRRQGLVRGSPSGELELDFVPLQEDVRVGDRIVTAGIDGIYPRGLPVGTVVEVSPGEELFHRIRVAPRVDFGRLDHVYLLDAERVPQEIVNATEVGDAGG